MEPLYAYDKTQLLQIYRQLAEGWWTLHNLCSEINFRIAKHLPTQHEMEAMELDLQNWLLHLERPWMRDCYVNYQTFASTQTENKYYIHDVKHFLEAVENHQKASELLQ